MHARTPLLPNHPTIWNTTPYLNGLPPTSPQNNGMSLHHPTLLTHPRSPTRRPFRRCIREHVDAVTTVTVVACYYYCSSASSAPIHLARRRRRRRRRRRWRFTACHSWFCHGGAIDNVRRPIWDSNIVREIKPTLETIGWFSGWYGIMGEDRRAWSIKHQEGSVIIISFIIDRPWWMWMCSYLSILSSIDWMSIDSVVPGTGTGTVLWDNTRTLPYYNSDGQTIYK